MGVVIRIHAGEEFYLRDPAETDLGRRLVSRAIKLIDKEGFLNFTFKKLAEDLGSTEASMYRYFESKHRLLEYMISWYWSWLEYLITYKITNVADPKEKLRIIIGVLIESGKDDPLTEFVDEAALHRIVIKESARSLSPKRKGSKQNKSLAEGYERLGKCIGSVFKEIHPRYKYAKNLYITLLTSTHRLDYFSENFPTLTDARKGTRTKDLAQYLEQLVLRALGKD